MLTMEYFEEGILLNFAYERHSPEYHEAWFQYLYLLTRGVHPTWIDDTKLTEPFDLEYLIQDFAERMTLNMNKAEKISICGENSKAKAMAALKKSIKAKAEALIADVLKKVATFKQTERYKEIIAENRLIEARKFALYEYENTLSKMSVEEIEKRHGPIRAVQEKGLWGQLSLAQKRIVVDEAA